MFSVLPGFRIFTSWPPYKWKTLKRCKLRQHQHEKAVYFVFWLMETMQRSLKFIFKNKIYELNHPFKWEILRNGNASLKNSLRAGHLEHQISAPHSRFQAMRWRSAWLWPCFKLSSYISFVDFKPEKHNIANTLYMADLKLVTQMETNNCQAPQAICNYSVLQTCLFHISFGGRESIFQ